MNNIQKAKHKSNKLIVFEAEQHSKSVGLISKFNNAIIELKAFNIEVDELQVKQETDLTGITTDKHQTRDLLSDVMVDFAGALQSNAREKNNNALYERVNFTESSIDKLTHDELITAATILAEEIAKLSPEELAAEGLNDADVVELNKLLQEFKISNPAKQQATIERSNYTEKLRLLFIKSGNIRKNVLDKLISQFKRKDADFYLKYIAASNVIYKRSKKDTNGDVNIAPVKEV